MRSPRHTAASRRAVSRASPSCAPTSRRDATGRRLCASRAHFRPGHAATLPVEIRCHCVDPEAGLMLTNSNLLA